MIFHFHYIRYELITFSKGETYYILNYYLKELAKTNSGNLFYSPFSIHLIMFMASVGAASKTFDEMIDTIHLNKTTHSLETYRDLINALTVSILSYVRPL